jgi:hypothetical protein
LKCKRDKFEIGGEESSPEEDAIGENNSEVFGGQDKEGEYSCKKSRLLLLPEKLCGVLTERGDK